MRTGALPRSGWRRPGRGRTGSPSPPGAGPGAADGTFFSKPMNRPSLSLGLLEAWFRYAERDWSPLPHRHDRPGWGFYGVGYNGWGVQTQQKYLAAAAALAVFSADDALRAQAQARAMAALRWNLASHRSGPTTCTDGQPWGHTWISALGIERMMFGVERLRRFFTQEDHEALRRVLCSEAEWLLSGYRRGGASGIHADPWDASGRNAPESNLWNGALLWRAAALYPEHPHAALWQEQAHRFLINGVSVAADATDPALLGGRPIRERHIGANFFPHYALDHHGYLNVGYMIICLSNAAFLHFDLKQAGLAAPQTLHHHQADLWKVARELIFEDGRLIRVGGDTRVRYGYCQDYLLPSLWYAADHLGDARAAALREPLLALFAQEARHNGDGSFFGKRLEGLRRLNRLYHTRLESDRACVLAMDLAYGEAGPLPPAPAPPASRAQWAEPEYGAAWVRSPRRFASFAWRAYGLAQGLCLPPGDGHLAEWHWNLAGKVEFASHPYRTSRAPEAARRLERQSVHPFPGGFLTRGELTEGMELTLQEGWSGGESALHTLVFAALPDDRTVLGVQFCRTTEKRHTLLRAVKGLHLNLPNDLYNGFARTLETEGGTVRLEAPAPREETIPLGSRWAVVEGRLGVVGIAGAQTLAISRETERRGGTLESLYVEEIGFPMEREGRLVAPGETVLDVAWAVLSGAGAPETRAFSHQAMRVETPHDAAGLRVIRAPGADGCVYTLAVHFGVEPLLLAGGAFEESALLAATDGGAPSAPLPPGQARLYQTPTAERE